MSNASQVRAVAGHRPSNHGITFPRLYDLLVRILTRGRERAYREALLDLAKITPGERLLDIGCGTGTLAIAAWRRLQPGGSVAATDVSEPMLGAARRKFRRAGVDIETVHADASNLPFATGRFDAVTATTVWHMLSPADQQTALLEAARVLKPGGRLLLVDYAGPRDDRTHWSARVGPHGQFDLLSLREGLAQAGFDNIEDGPTGWLSLHFLRAIRQ